MGKNPGGGNGTLDNQWAIMPLSGNPLDVPGSSGLKSSRPWCGSMSTSILLEDPGGDTLRGEVLRARGVEPNEFCTDPRVRHRREDEEDYRFVAGYHTDGCGSSSRTWERSQFTLDWGTNVVRQGGVDAALAGRHRGQLLPALRPHELQHAADGRSKLPLMHLQGIPERECCDRWRGLEPWRLHGGRGRARAPLLIAAACRLPGTATRRPTCTTAASANRSTSN